MREERRPPSAISGVASLSFFTGSAGDRAGMSTWVVGGVFAEAAARTPTLGSILGGVWRGGPPFLRGGGAAMRFPHMCPAGGPPPRPSDVLGEGGAASVSTTARKLVFTSCAASLRAAAQSAVLASSRRANSNSSARMVRAMRRLSEGSISTFLKLFRRNFSKTSKPSSVGGATMMMHSDSSTRKQLMDCPSGDVYSTAEHFTSVCPENPTDFPKLRFWSSSKDSSEASRSDMPA
mmetsp:Transcript_30224/g.76034  ORF Transcript_30224/g.76034 Transcript_30224/m.76034 type:complete len:235 (+) Transcript_30224:978-1682(+)